MSSSVQRDTAAARHPPDIFLIRLLKFYLVHRGDFFAKYFFDAGHFFVIFLPSFLPSFFQLRTTFFQSVIQKQHTFLQPRAYFFQGGRRGRLLVRRYLCWECDETFHTGELDGIERFDFSE